MPKTVRRNFENFKGINKSFSALTKPQEFAEEAKNCFITENFDLEQRPGGKALVRSHQAFPPVSYSYLDSTGTSQSQLMFLDYARTTLQPLTVEYISVAYNGSGTGQISFLPTGSEWELTILEDGLPVTGFPKTYGTIFEDGTRSDLPTLISDIDGLTDWSCAESSWTADSGDLAALLPLIELQAVDSGGTLFPYYKDSGELDYEELSTRPYAAGSYVSTFTQMNDCLFFYPCTWSNTDNFSGYLFKYDGTRPAYPAGLPAPSFSGTSISSSGAGSNFLANTTYNYLYRISKTDGRGNVVQSALSDVKSFTVGGANVTSLILPLPFYNKGYGCMSVTVNGNQTGVNTITVSVPTPWNTSYLYVGEKVYFYDGVSSSYVTRNITSISSTTITVDGDAVDVTNGAIISNNVKVEIYRTKGGSNSPYYFVEEVPMGIVASYPTYTDSTPDSSLSENLIEPDFVRTQPPIGKYSCTHQGLLFLTGNEEYSNRIYFNDVTGVEYFDADLGFLDLPFTTSGGITGMGSDGQNLFVFKRKERAVIQGDFVTNSYFVEVLSDGIGCTSHASITRGELGLYFMSDRGPQRLTDRNIDLAFNLRLLPDFRNQEYKLVDDTTITSEQEAKLYTPRATSFLDSRNKQVHFFVPALSGLPSLTTSYANIVPNENSWWYVYDEKVDAWTKMSSFVGFYPSGGGCVHDGKLYLAGDFPHIFSGSSYTDESCIIELYDGADSYSAADDYAAIEFCYESAWDTMENPSVYKKWLRFRTWSMRLLNRIGATISVTIFKNFNDSDALSSFSQDFTDSTTLEKRNKITSHKALTTKVKFYNNTLHEAPRITGYEMEVSLPYEGGELEKP